MSIVPGLCVHCGAKPGEPCKRKNGRKTVAYHAGRPISVNNETMHTNTPGRRDALKF